MYTLGEKKTKPKTIRTGIHKKFRVCHLQVLFPKQIAFIISCAYLHKMPHKVYMIHTEQKEEHTLSSNLHPDYFP